MAGIIQKQMPGGQMADQSGGEAQADENNPQFIQAMKFALQVMYKEGAAKAIAEQLRTAPNKQEGLADIAYEITSVVDERTGGKVPRELVALLAMAILKEVMDIGQAAKMDIRPEEAAGAFKDMLLRYLGENGVDTTQLQQGMDQVDPAVFTQ